MAGSGGSDLKLFAVIALAAVVLVGVGAVVFLPMGQEAVTFMAQGIGLKEATLWGFGVTVALFVLFAVVSVGVVGLIVLYHGRAGRSLYLSIALGLLLGGAIGNMIDRLRLGYVVDWVDIGLGDLRFWTFNVADSAISLAIVMLVAMAIFPALTGSTQAEADA